MMSSSPAQRAIPAAYQRIEQEHHVFTALICDVLTTHRRPSGRDRVLRALAEIRKYADYHFFSEENVMLDGHYPHFQSHRMEHRMMLNSLDAHIAGYTAGSTDLATVTAFLEAWLESHSADADRRLREHFQPESTG